MKVKFGGMKLKNKQKKIGLLLILSILFWLQTPSLTVAEPSRTRLDIEVTLDGEPATAAEIGEIIRVTVSMTEFENLTSVSPSLHFNPHIVQVVHPTTRVRFPKERIVRPSTANRFFILGPTMEGTASPERWAGSIPAVPSHPFLDNGQGLIGMFLERDPHHLNGTQEIYSIYFEVIGAGNADIRLSRWSDTYRDGLITDEETYAIYNFNPYITDPNIRRYDSHVYEISPDFWVQDPATRVYTRSGRLVERLSDIRDGSGNVEDIFATRIGSEANFESTVRLVLAVYDNGRFYDLRIGNSEATEFIELPENVETATIKVFVWDSLSNMRPLLRPMIIDM